MADEINGVQSDGEGTLWLYKQHGLLLGPMSYEEMVQLIESGAIDGKTVACPQGSDDEFLPISQNSLFMVALARAGVRTKVEAQKRQKDSRRRKAAGVKAGVIVLLSIIGIGLIGVGASYLAIHRPWERKVNLPDPIITDELPVIALSTRRNPNGDEEGMFYPPPEGNTEVSKQVSTKKADSVVGKALANAKGAAKKQDDRSGALSPKAKERSKPATGDGFVSQQEWDENAIQMIVAKKKKTLHPCLTAEAHRQSSDNPMWSARIPLEFTVANNGKVAKLWIDHRDYKDKESPLYKCMLKTLGTWKFPAYNGEQANVSIAFNVQAR